ncbi:MAG: VCBS repeat-containing protein [Bacteroidetes bacterium]|nr:VCBS repeat-containing protein [Bacteroidota bacterium]
MRTAVLIAMLLQFPLLIREVGVLQVQKGLEFTLADDLASGIPRIIVFEDSAASRESYLKVFGPQGDKLFQHPFSGRMYASKTFQRQNKIFFFSGKLYFLDLATFHLDSVALMREDYRGLTWVTTGKRDVLIASYADGIDLFDLQTVTLVQEIKRDEEIRLAANVPVEDNGVMIFQSKENELRGYDLASSRILWSYSFGSQPGYYLGIKIGTARDIISHFAVVRENEKPAVVAASFSGTLVKLDLHTGRVILKKERFKGTGNNAGLIGHFTMLDMNGDGVQDLVGGSVDYNVYCINGKDFSVLWEYNTGYENQMPCSFADVNGDGTPDVFSVNDEYRFTVLDGKTGKLIYETIVQEGVKKGWNQTKVLLADLNNNGLLDVIVKGGWDKLRIFELREVRVPKNAIVWIPGRYPTTQVR